MRRHTFPFGVSITAAELSGEEKGRNKLELFIHVKILAYKGN